MKILYFGSYERTNVRYRVIKKGLEKNNIKILECHVPFWELTTHKAGSFFENKASLFFNIIYIQLKLFFKSFKYKDYDLIWVSYIGQFDMFVAKLISKIRKKPVIFDPLVALSETLLERGLIKKDSFLYKFSYALDKCSCKAADLIIIDTNKNLKYFSKEFNIPKNKLCRIFVGADDDIFYPVNKKHKTFTVTFFGKFIPGHGLEYIIDAARELKNKDIKFKLIGTGQTFEKIKEYAKGLSNVEFVGWVAYEKLPQYVADADICLGLFKDTKKIKNVIATKVFEAMAMKKALITGESPAIKEILINRENVLFCKLSDGKPLANAILTLKKEKSLKDKIADNSYKLYKSKFTPKSIGKEVIKCLKTKGYL